MANDLSIDLATIPLAVIRTASDRWLGADNWQGKTRAIGLLAGQINNGRITLADVRAVTPQPPIMPNGGVSPDAFDVALKPVTQIADSAQAAALDALTKARALESSITDVRNFAVGRGRELDDLKASVQIGLDLQEKVANEVLRLANRPLVDDA